MGESVSTESQPSKTFGSWILFPLALQVKKKSVAKKMAVTHSVGATCASGDFWAVRGEELKKAIRTPKFQSKPHKIGRLENRRQRFSRCKPITASGSSPFPP